MDFRYIVEMIYCFCFFVIYFYEFISFFEKNFYVKNLYVEVFVKDKDGEGGVKERDIMLLY